MKRKETKGPLKWHPAAEIDGLGFPSAGPGDDAYVVVVVGEKMYLVYRQPGKEQAAEFNEPSSR